MFLRDEQSYFERIGGQSLVQSVELILEEWVVPLSAHLLVEYFTNHMFFDAFRSETGFATKSIF